MHLFAGAGGGLLADRILGHDPIIAVEWNKYACRTLRQRAAEGWFPGLYVWEGDVSLFDPSEYAGRVDCIHAGFPCQDLSVAGNGAGLGEGTRSGLYREVLRIAGVVRPEFIFLENVSAILSRGLGVVLGDLSSCGYNAKWLCLRASDVGAPHHRDRWFLLARRTDTNSLRQQQPQGTEPEVWRRSGDVGETQNDANPVCIGCNGGCGDRGKRCVCGKQKRNTQESEQERREWKSRAGALREDVPYSMLKGLQRRQESGNPVEGRKNGDKQLTGLREHAESSYWSTEPAVGRVANGVASRVDRIKAIGNGQVPLQAAAAFSMLMSIFKTGDAK